MSVLVIFCSPAVSDRKPENKDVMEDEAGNTRHGSTLHEFNRAHVQHGAIATTTPATGESGRAIVDA